MLFKHHMCGQFTIAEPLFYLAVAFRQSERTSMTRPEPDSGTHVSDQSNPFSAWSSAEAGACPVALWNQVDESLWLEMLRYGHNEQTTHSQKSIVL